MVVSRIELLQVSLLSSGNFAQRIVGSLVLLILMLLMILLLLDNLMICIPNILILIDSEISMGEIRLLRLMLELDEMRLEI